MIKVDIVNFYDNLKEKWETKIGVILLIILVIPIYFLLFDYFVGRESTYNWLVYKVLIPLVMLLLIICYWLYNTNRFFLRTTGKITAGIIVIIDNEKDKPVISKIVSKVVHHINNSTAFSNVSLKILPANSFVTKKEIEKYHRNFNFMYDIIIQLFIESGQYDSIEKIIVEKLSVTFRPKDGIKQKRVFFNTVDLSRDMDLQVKSRDWEYKLSNSGVDNKKYFENILPMFLYYLGFYAIYVDRFEDALEIMTPIYNSKNTIVPISKKEGNILELKLKPLNLAEARLATILVDLFFYTAIITYQNSETEKALTYFKKLEEIIKSHPKKFDQYISMARYSYELNKLDEAISYTERAQKLEPNNDAIFLNLGFFSILNNDIEKFCSNYYEIFKNRNKSKINWVDVLDFQLKQQETITDKNHFFNFSTGFIEYVILNQMNRESFQRIVDSYKSNNEYHCIYELGIKVLSNKINTAKPNTKNNRPIEKKKNRKSR
jgi:tetratricopeptide (TPR) repeat protein